MTLQQTHLKAAAEHATLQETLLRLHTLRQQLHDSSSVVENTNITVRETNQLVTHTHTAGWLIPSDNRVKGHQQIYGMVRLLFLFYSAYETHRKLEELDHRTEHLMERIKPLNMLGETLSRNLSDIRELIDQARRQAASVLQHTEIHTVN